MDFTLIGVAASAMSAAKEFGKAALNVRDFAEMAPVIAGLNEQLLKAQDALFIHNTHLLALQQKEFETAKKLREMEETIAQRGRYSLVEITTGIFTYGMNISPVSSDVSHPIGAEPMHYLCQSCFDKGIKSVLQRDSLYGSVYLDCVCCQKKLYNGERERSGL
ncbi:hypothetical protein [Glaciimonas sp. PAMC28666]|uniref:hypothetical protein n=1 Tax=Glaciimonas sp. PAMC28666 TaxID=2807626 RepID=UPI001963E4C8|nr:hypothetical protein [Glaciimonas sp. PAMC28666]QRX82229.1 hypothetical protein JQN73_19385 [Glaciimonas sp. PAMC28666]